MGDWPVMVADLSNVTGTLAATSGGTGLSTYAQGDILYSSATNVLSKLAKDANATRYLANTGTSNNPAWAQVALTTGVSGVLPVANGGTNASSASITAFNNITGLTTAGTTGTTSTNLVFSTSPSFTTPLLGTPTSGVLTNCSGYVEANLTITDVTTNNASTSAHGFLKKLSNTATEFMNGAGNWAVPGGSGDMLYSDARFEIVETTRDTSAASGTQAITGAGFAPKAVIIIASRGAPNGSIGFAEENATDEGADFYYNGTVWGSAQTSNVITLIEAGGVNYNNATVTTWGADGITLTWTKTASPTGTADIFLLFFR